MPYQSLHRSARPEATISDSSLASSRFHRPDNDTRPACASSGGSARREARARRERRISMTRKKVENLRGQVTRSRLELRELRVELRPRHVQIRQMQARFWRGLQNQWNDDRTLDKTTLQQLDDDIRRALDELGPKEANYDEKEDDLDLLEYKLGKLEDRLYSTDADRTGSKAGFASSSSSSSSSRSRSTIPTRPEEEASWNYRYLSRVGDANIVRERLEELSFEKSQYVDLERERTAMGLDLYQPNVEFLDTFEEVYAKNEFELREIEQDLQRLQNESRSISPTAVKLFETIDLLQESTSLEHEHEAPQTPRHRDSLRRKSDGDLHNVQVDTSTVRQRVNQWILEVLEVSAFERAKHRAMLHDPNLDNHTWLSLVKAFWQPDQDAVSPPLSRRRSSKSPRSVSRYSKSFSHSPQCLSNLNEQDIGVDAMDSPRDISTLWDTERQYPPKRPVHEQCGYQSPSPRSLYPSSDYFVRDGFGIYSTSY